MKLLWLAAALASADTAAADKKAEEPGTALLSITGVAQTLRGAGVPRLLPEEGAGPGQPPARSRTA